jgi:hypothetical protein
MWDGRKVMGWVYHAWIGGETDRRGDMVWYCVHADLHDFGTLGMCRSHELACSGTGIIRKNSIESNVDGWKEETGNVGQCTRRIE